MAALISDARNKEVALRRIKRLASSALPLEPFVLILLELANDAVASSPLKALLPGTDDAARYICNSPELYAALPLATRFFFNSREDPDKLGLRTGAQIANYSRLSAGRTLLRHDETYLSSFHRTEAFNVATKPLGWWRSTSVLPRDEDGEVCGLFPVWRGADQKDFSAADYSFLRACAPHIAHGLRTAQLIEHRGSIGLTDFVPSALWAAA